MPRLTSGPVLPAVLQLAWPVIVAEGLHTAFQIVDVAWVGGLGPAATAAATTAMFASWIVVSLASLVTTGVTAHVSRAMGAGQRGEAGRVAAQALNVAFLLGIAVAFAGWLGAPGLFRLIGAGGDVASLGTLYLRIMTLTSPATFLYLAAGSVMRASGNTRTPMLITGACLLANAALDPLLIYGWAGFPRLGIAGAAVATGLCQAGAVAAFAVLAARRAPSLPLAAAELGTPDWRRIAEIARVGAPYCLMITGFSVVYLFFSHFAARFGAESLAVLGIGNRLESICYLPADGFATASATMVGQNLGAGLPGRARRAAWSAVTVMAFLAALLTLLFLAAPAAMVSVFSKDATVVALGVPYLRVIALCQIATGVEGVMAGAFAGAGDTLPPLGIHLAFATVRVPLAYLMSLHFGLMGIAWTISLTCIVRALVLGGWFLRGSWIDRKLSALPVAAQG